MPSGRAIEARLFSRPADTDSDRELIEAARAAIQRTYDIVHENHTVGAAV